MQNQGGRRVTACAQVVKHRGCLFKEQWQIIFNARSGNPMTNVFVDAAFGGIAI